jgi:hypothetical protein
MPSTKNKEYIEEENTNDKIFKTIPDEYTKAINTEAPMSLNKNKLDLNKIIIINPIVTPIAPPFNQPGIFLITQKID